MNQRVMLAILVAFIFVSAATAQEITPLTDKSQLDKPTSVMILKNGEQIVIRGDFVIKGELAYFYYEHGSHPVYASIAADSIDQEASEKANTKLKRERRKRELYYQLIEARRQKILEEGNVLSTPVIQQGGDSSDQPSANVGSNQPVRVTRQVAQTFHPYNEEDIRSKDEAWWREETARLFKALEESNARMRALFTEHDAKVVKYNQSRTQAEADRLKKETDGLKAQITRERSKGKLIGNRLAELSEMAETLRIPMDWFIPEGTQVYDENEESQPDAELPEMDQPATQVETKEYAAAELRNVADEWWGREMARLNRAKDEAETRRFYLRQAFNQLTEKRRNSADDAEKFKLSKEIDTAVAKINAEETNLVLLEKAMASLTQAAKDLGKEDKLGLLIEKQEEQ